MSPETLGTALRDLVDDVEDGMDAPVADELWADGRRRRRTTRLVPAVAAACVAALVTVALWPGGVPRASVPAVQVDGDGYARLTAYPSAIPKPPFVSPTARPGLTAAVLEERADTVELFAVSPAGAVSHLELPDSDLDRPLALSPDGRWLAQGSVLSDLVDGATVPSDAARADLDSKRTPAGSAWWSPDSRRVYVDGVNQGKPTSSGVVVATDGTVTEVPLLAGGGVPTIAGWLDSETLLAFVGVGASDDTLAGRTWRAGATAWEVSGPDVGWPYPGPGDGSQVTSLSAGLSPDGARLLLTRRVVDASTQVFSTTQAMMFDARTGAQLGMPGADGSLTPSAWEAGSYVEWGGGGCRPAWRDGQPVSTDDGTVRLQ
jgi:hypothetical protein